jgi:hypothetical protein
MSETPRAGGQDICDCCGGDPRIVCDACDQHSCWAGEFMCEDAWTAGTYVREDGGQKR